MIHLDVNVLVNAFRIESPDHQANRTWLDGTLAGDEEVGLGELALTSFLRVVTNAKVFVTPAPIGVAFQFVSSLQATPNVRAVHASMSSWKVFRELTQNDAQIRGNLVPDAWLAALALSHGARFATADRRFARYPGLKLVDPTRPSPTAR